MEDMMASLIKLHESTAYPFHMPGHKRNADFIRKYDMFPKGTTPYDIDITEIDGFDDLHDAEGIIKTAEEAGARLSGAARTIFSVNGSTGGLLAAIGAVTEPGSSVIMARNCHKAVYHALELFSLTPVYMNPGIVNSTGISGSISPDMVEMAFRKAEEDNLAKPSCVIITSPTYEGVVSDIKSIAELVHNLGAVLIVDEAHGAHFGIMRDDSGALFFPENAVRLGADIVIESYHKTLPCYTQTAAVHVSKEAVSSGLYEGLCHMFDILETSSPSYILMAGMERVLNLLLDKGEELMSVYAVRLQKFQESVSDLRSISTRLQGDDIYSLDPGKLVITVPYLCGPDIYERLQRDHGLVLEMRSRDYALAMTSMCDTKEGFARLSKALHELDRLYEGKPSEVKIYEPQVPEMVMTPFEAMKAVRRFGRTFVPYEEAVGRVSADYVYFYPPGVPVLVPGEKISGYTVEQIRLAVKAGVIVKGGGNAYGTYICNDG